MNKLRRIVLMAGFLLTACAGQTTAPDTAGSATAAPVLQFVASDPAGVKLAAGKPQLVEFFAFW